MRKTYLGNKRDSKTTRAENNCEQMVKNGPAEMGLKEPGIDKTVQSKSWLSGVIDMELFVDPSQGPEGTI